LKVLKVLKDLPGKNAGITGSLLFKEKFLTIIVVVVNFPNRKLLKDIKVKVLTIQTYTLVIFSFM
jgi:hypothetical protein